MNLKILEQEVSVQIRVFKVYVFIWKQIQNCTRVLH